MGQEGQDVQNGATTGHPRGGEEREKRGLGQRPIVVAFYVALVMTTMVIFIFLLIPGTVKTFTAICPDKFSKVAVDRVDKVLAEGYDEVIANTSFVVGLISIGFALYSSHTMERQSERQEAVLQRIQQKSEEILLRVAQVAERVEMIYEVKKDLNYHIPSQPKKANEGNG